MGTPDAPEDPFKNYKPDDSIKAKHQGSGGVQQGATARQERLFPEKLDEWSRWQWNGIYKHSMTLHPTPPLDVANEWDIASKILKDGFDKINSDMKSITADQWGGEAATAAQNATQQYVKDAEALHAAVLSMKSNLEGLSDALDVTKGNVVTPEEVRDYAIGVFKHMFPHKGSLFTGLNDETCVDVSIDPNTHEVLATLNEFRNTNYPPATSDQVKHAMDTINESANHGARLVMQNTLDKGLTTSDENVPVFIGTSVAPHDGPDSAQPPGAGVPNAGGPGGPGASMPTAVAPGSSTPDFKTQPATLKAPTTSSSNASTAANGALQGLQQASGLGQSALSQAQNAAQQALSQLEKAKTAAHLPTTLPAGLAALKKASAAKLAGAGGGGGGKGAGGGGAGLGKSAGALAKGLTAKEANLASGVRNAMSAEERAAAAASRGAAASSAPMGAGGAGGARGAGGGEDKEHKANKYLRTTRNGEAILGEPPTTAPVVIKD